jgi:hypothetical protein
MPQIIRFPIRTVCVQREDSAWLVRVGSNGWLHGSRRAALEDAQWLAANFNSRIVGIKSNGSPHAASALLRRCTQERRQ